MANDQAARETVARVVELSQLVLAAAPEPAGTAEVVSPVLRNRAWMQPVGWIAVGAAACLAVVMAYQSFVPPSGTTQMASLAPGSASDLALAWAIARAELPGPEEAAPTTPAAIATNPGGEQAEVAEQPRIAHASEPFAVASDSPTGDSPTGDSPTGDSPNVDSPNADPMEEFTDPVAPAWLLVAVEDARHNAAQEN